MNQTVIPYFQMEYILLLSFMILILVFYSLSTCVSFNCYLQKEKREVRRFLRACFFTTSLKLRTFFKNIPLRIQL